MIAASAGPWVIRAADDGDLHALRALAGTADMAPPPQSLDADVERILAAAGRGVVLVAESEARTVIGALVAETHADSARLIGLFVASRQRRSGVARALLEAAESRLSGKGIRCIQVELPASGEANAQSLEKLGFRRQPPTIRLQRDLEPAADALTAAGAADDEAILHAAASRGEQRLVSIHSPGPRRWTLFHLVMGVAALICLANTDIYSPDMIKGALLPIADVVFLFYFVALLVNWNYRRRADASRRADRLFDAGRGDGGR